MTPEDKIDPEDLWPIEPTAIFPPGSFFPVDSTD